MKDALPSVVGFVAGGLSLLWGLSLYFHTFPLPGDAWYAFPLALSISLIAIICAIGIGVAANFVAFTALNRGDVTK
jgi:ABC-type Fe3+ transport system permease subunit